MEQPVKRITRSSTNRMVSGVCGGLAEYFNVDPTLIRLLFVILILSPGPGFLVYLVLWWVIPQENPFAEKAKNNLTL